MIPRREGAGTVSPWSARASAIARTRSSRRQNRLRDTGRPTACHSHIRLVNPPGPIRLPHLAAKPLIQNRRIALDPARNCDIVNREISLRHDLLQVAICERVSQIPSNAQQYDHVFKMPPAEKCRPSSGHDTPYQISSTAFATEPFKWIFTHSED